MQTIIRVLLILLISSNLYAGGLGWGPQYGANSFKGAAGSPAVTYTMTLGVVGDSTLTIESTGYTSVGSPHTITGLSGITSMDVTYGGTDDTTVFSGTDSGDVTGSSPNFSIDMDDDKSLICTFSTAPVVPTFTSWTVQPNGISSIIVFSEAMTFGVGGSGGLTSDTPTYPYTYVSGDTTDTITFSHATINSTATDNPTGTYVQPTDGWQSVSGSVELASESGITVTNNSTQTQSDTIIRPNSDVTSSWSDFTLSSGTLGYPLVNDESVSSWMSPNIDGRFAVFGFPNGECTEDPDAVTVHILADVPSTAGSVRFRIHGELDSTVVPVSATTPTEYTKVYTSDPLDDLPWTCSDIDASDGGVLIPTANGLVLYEVWISFQ